MPARAPLFLAAASLLLASPAFSAPPSPDYELLFEEQFDGTELDTSRWRHRIDRRQNEYLNGLNRAENVSVSGGFLRIAARTEVIDGQTEYTGGGVISLSQFGYGYYESRSRPFMAGKGVHAAFWQAGGNVPNNQIFEIDGYEIDSTHLSADNNLYIHLGIKDQTWVPWPLRSNIPITLDSDGWFLDGYEYTPEGVFFYDNGKRVASIKWPDLTAAQVVWLTALNGTGKVDVAKQPGETLFDYFRYYAKDYPGHNILPNGGFEYNQDKVDPTKPISWQPSATPADALRVTAGDASRDHYKLTVGSATEDHTARLAQSLEYIRNGTYHLSAVVRTSGGQERAEIVVDGLGGPALSLALPRTATPAWTRVSLANVPVTKNGARFTLHVAGRAGQWIEVDDIRFMKPPLPGAKLPPERPFVLISDPIWQICDEPTPYNDGRSFNFFDRMVGYGDAITVSFVMTPESSLDCSPIARIPKAGTSGWAVLLSRSGDVVFRIGSTADYRDVIAKRAYKTKRPQLVTCVFDRGTASVYVDGRRVAVETGITHDTKDRKQAGKLGAVGDTGEAIGDVTVRDEQSGGRGGKNTNYRGLLRDVRVYNRALTPDEIAKLPRT
ncbi:MAG: hypothetical protein MUE42_02505 [Opitutaceae bacterium]|jgi:beta-glucanase (GH16 family)|nr:hypothetical protein [Opitutaceae bacterium]